MKANVLNKEQLKKEIKRLKKNLSRRIARIEGYDKLVPSPAVQKYKDVVKDFPKNLSKLKETELNTIYRDLSYVNNLKTSTIKGAKNYTDKFQPLMEKLETLSPDLRDKFWSTYNRVVEEAQMLKSYKYELFDEIMDELMSGTSPEDIQRNLTNVAREVYESGKEDYRKAIVYASRRLSR